MEKIQTAIAAALCALVVAICTTGCAGSTGWRFEVGVSPVKSLNNQAGLNQTDTRKVTSVKDY